MSWANDDAEDFAKAWASGAIPADAVPVQQVSREEIAGLYPFVIVVPSSGGFWNPDRWAAMPRPAVLRLPAVGAPVGPRWMRTAQLPERDAPPEQRPDEDGKDE